MKKNFEKLLQIYWKELRKKKILIVKEKLSLQTQPTKARVAITKLVEIINTISASILS